ncbi:unnamed protein product [Polarella glacialis]|uniref:BCNT-C domain-containing protein n=1 Tax=Polarella glacialis TaxID=89957 RepID=A0A813LTE1_POLGL|nr:unnamed protein product [Polarella glacialis]
MVASDESSSVDLRVVFLDVDGVLHSADAVPGGSCLPAAAESLFLPQCLERLKRIVDETGSVIVLSSTWRLDLESLAEVGHRLASWDLVISDVTSSSGHSSRAGEVAEWLLRPGHRERLLSFVVLDDLDLTDELGVDNCIVVDGDVGLTDLDAETAIGRLTTTGPEQASFSWDDVLGASKTGDQEAAWRRRWEQLERQKKEKKKSRQRDKSEKKRKEERELRSKEKRIIDEMYTSHLNTDVDESHCTPPLVARVRISGDEPKGCIVEWQTGHRLYLAFMSEQLRRTADLQNEAESTSRSLRTHMMALQAKGSGAPEDDLRFAAPGGAAPEVAPENRHGGSFSPSKAMPSAIPPAIPEAIRATSAGGPSAASAASDARVAAVRGVLEEIEQVLLCWLDRKLVTQAFEDAKVPAFYAVLEEAPESPGIVYGQFQRAGAIPDELPADAAEEPTSGTSSAVDVAVQFAEMQKEEAAQVAYSNSVQADAPQPKSVAELKKQVRAAAQEGGSAPSACGLQPHVRATSVVIEDTVRFAGEAVAVRRRLTPGSAEELRWQQAQKRRKTATLGGTIGSALDAFLLGSAAGSGGGREVSSVEKSGIDWKRHKEESGLENLSSDPHAGALDRRDFLARAAFRSEAAARAAQRAAQRAAAARKGVARKA